VKREGFKFNPTICVSTIPLDLDEWVEDNIESIIVHETMHIAVTRLEGMRASLSIDNVMEHLGDLNDIIIW
jgi:predicted metallopeptidase